MAAVSRSRTAASSPRFEILITPPPPAPSSIRNVWSRSLPRSTAVPCTPNNSAATAATSSAAKRGGGASSTFTQATLDDGWARTGRPTRRHQLGKRHVLREERAGRRRVEPVVDVRRATVEVARDRDRGDDVRLPCAGSEEVRTAGVAVARATVAGRSVLRDPQPRIVAG